MISVIVPVYNSRDTLARCVKSLQAQTLADLEIILVDDGSSDGSGMLCNGFSREDARIRVIHKANGGVSSARNAGIEAAKGRYLMFMDSDDYAEPEMAEAMLSGIGEDDIAICGFHHHYQGRDVVRIPDVPGQSGEENFLALYGQGFLNMPWNKLYKRELAGRFDESLSLGEDLLFNLDYLRRTDGISVVKEALCHYIQDETGMSLSSQKREDKLELAKRIWKETRDFYRELSGHEDESGVINARLVQEALDDVEALPFDSGKTKKEKLAVISDYCQDRELTEAGADAALKALDYKVIHFCMRRGWKRLTYDLCDLRAALVRGRRGSGTSEEQEK
ncbi:MAG TPA: glycosyltransferase [Candidatus Merdisoma merdipullorum]|nr:glycosyltransferase [Candidatus Merdisoma merdipullorum]